MIRYLFKNIVDAATPYRSGVRAYWWSKLGYLTERPNFGDALAPELAKRIGGVECTWSHPKRAEFLGGGSTLEMVQLWKAPESLKVWGAGFLAPTGMNGRDYDHPNFDFHAVRGRLTRERIDTSNTVAVGDPGLLVSKAYPRAQVVPGKIGLVYNHNHRREAKQVNGVTLIDPLRDPGDVIADITSCEFVFASSLHGLVVADSFGIPNAWVGLGDLFGGRFKFDDYYSAFDGRAVRHDPSVLGDVSAVRWLERSYRGVPDLDRVQTDLIEAFPL